MTGARDRPPRSGSIAEPGAFLDPVMALVERIDRRRRGIRPVREGAVIGIELGRWRGRPVDLRDGTVVASGAPIGILHFDNVRLRALTAQGSLAPAWHQGRGDLRALAAWASDQPADRRPVAYFGEGLHAVVARRVGFEVRPRPRMWFTRLQDWYFRGLMARWAPAGRGRLAIGRRELHAAEYWLSAAALDRLHGRAPSLAGSRPAPSDV
jgi:hypothetical protein